jgi:hypothetical protein
MSELSRAIKEHVKEALSSEKVYSTLCEVVSIDESSKTCQLNPINGDAERKGRLQASISLSEGVYIKPVVGSYVLLSYINNITGIITSYSEIESIETITSNGGSFSINTKFSFSNNEANLLAVLTDLLTAIKNITVPTPEQRPPLPDSRRRINSPPRTIIPDLLARLGIERTNLMCIHSRNKELALSRNNAR